MLIRHLQAPIASTSKLSGTNGASALSLPVTAGFSWAAGEQDEEMATGAASGESDDEGSDDERVEEAQTVSSAVAAGKRKATNLSALDDRTGDLDSQAPTSVADFERMLLGSPNSSYLWIQYIAFFVGLSQLDKAREIARRAINTINFREEQEKLNVWVALLNLENSYGDETSLDETFKEAAQSNDAKTIYLRLIDIYERTGKLDVSHFARVIVLIDDAHSLHLDRPRRSFSRRRSRSSPRAPRSGRSLRSTTCRTVVLAKPASFYREA